MRPVQRSYKSQTPATGIRLYIGNCLYIGNGLYFDIRPPDCFSQHYYNTNILRTQQNFYFVAFRRPKIIRANVWPFWTPPLSPSPCTSGARLRDHAHSQQNNGFVSSGWCFLPSAAWCIYHSTPYPVLFLLCIMQLYKKKESQPLAVTNGCDRFIAPIR